MGLVELFLLSLGLAMDAFAVSVSEGLRHRIWIWPRVLWIALSFGFFQAILPAFGYFLSISFAKQMETYDHWIVFSVFHILGIKMLKDMFSKRDSETEKEVKVHFFSRLFFLSFAVSLDAFAVGCMLPLLDIGLLPACLSIGVVTFLLSFSGVSLGVYFGKRVEVWAEGLGGVLLILLGWKFLLEHLLGL